MEKYEIVKEAREWLGDKWQHQASLKGVACDCVGLIRGVYEKLTNTPIIVDIEYPATWHLFKSDPWLYEECCKHAIEIPIEEAGEGDILLFGLRDAFPASHIAILTAENTIIHSYMDVGKVVENGYDKNWKDLVRHAFRFPGVK